MSPLSKYFQGVSVHGPVRAFAARSFADIVDQFRVCPTIPLSRAAFLALPKAERNEKKQVPFFTPACFRESPSKRVYEQAVCCNLIFLDVDDAKDAAPFVRNPESLYQALEGFSFAAHTTASSTPEKPRLRIVVDAHEIPIADYPKAVATIGAMLGLSRVTTESKVAVQPMFRSTLFLDSTDDDHPLIAYRVDGRAFEVDDISAEVPDTFGKNGNGNGADSHPPHEDAIFFLRAPVPEISLAVAKEALSQVDPDCAYYDWIEIAAALRHQFSPHKAEEAYELFDEWSSEGTKYAGEDDTRAKWKSLRATPHGRMPVTIRSLLLKAKAGGWDDQRVKENTHQRLLDWMENVKDATELLETGVQKILAAPLLSSMQEDILVDRLRSTAKRRFAVAVQAAAIRKDVTRLRGVMKAQERSTQRAEPAWAKGVLYVSNTREFYRRRTGEKYKTDAFNAVYGRWLLPKEDDLKNPTPASLCKPTVEPADYALNHLKLTTVTDFAYDPSQPTEMFFIEKGIKWVNTYNPTYPEPDPRHAAAAGEHLLRHLTNLIGEPEYRRVLTDFMAFIVQFPGRKIRWAPMVQGAEGCGKTLLGEMLKAVLGSEHVKTIDGTAVVSGWNEWATGYQMVVLEEVRVQGTNRYDIMNRMKAWITNDEIPINEKFRNNRDIRNITNYMMFSNFHDALALTANNRRYFVVKSPLQTKSQVQALGDEYFDTLFGFIEQHPGGMRSFLADWEISADFRPDGHAPQTKYATEMVQDSASDLIAAVRRLLLEADYPLIQYDIVSAKTLVDVLKLEDGLGNITGQQVAHVLREEGYHQVARHTFGEERHYLWARSGVGDVVATAVDREKRKLKNLSMELLFS